MRSVSRPNGAYKLLTCLLYGNYTCVEIASGGITKIQSLRRISRLLGTDSRNLKKWLQYLENSGYLESLTYSPNTRQATFRLRYPYGK